jgi:hypothetical protein
MADPAAPVIANMNYLRPTSERPAIYTEALDRMSAVRLEPHDVPIMDLRDCRDEAKLSTTGFELVDHRSEVTDFNSDEQHRKIYIPEIRELIRSVTGASRIHVTPPTLRWSEREAHPKIVNSRPARLVHVDYHRHSFHEFAARHVQKDPDREQWLAGRYAAFNIWRVVSPPPQDCPLAFLDRRTTTIADVVEGDVVVNPENAPEARIGTSFYTWSPGHRWGYFSDMTRDEVAIFLAFDSADDRLPGAPHAAFDDPTCSADAFPRASCELRAYVYWGCGESASGA